MRAIHGTVTDERLRATIADRTPRQVAVTVILEVAPGNTDTATQREDAAKAYVRHVLPCPAFSVAGVTASALG